MDKNDQISRLKDYQVKSRPKRIRSYFSPTQINKMEDMFAVDQFPDKDQIKLLSSSLDIGERSLMVWFQNRRARQRKARPEANQELLELRSSKSYPQSSGYTFETMAPCMQILQDIKRKGEDTIERISFDSQQIAPPSNETSPTRSNRISNRMRLSETTPSWHKTQSNSPKKQPMKVSSKQSIDKGDFHSPKPKRQRSLRSSDENSPKPGIKCSNFTDDYKLMVSNYQYQESPAFRNLYKTPSPLSKNSSLLSLSPDDNTILNLCKRDAEKGSSASSPILLSPEKTPQKPASLQPSEMYPHWNPHLAYGCPPEFPPMPSPAVVQYYAALYHFHMSMEAQYGEVMKSQMTSFPGLPPPFPVPEMETLHGNIPGKDREISESELTDKS